MSLDRRIAGGMLAIALTCAALPSVRAASADVDRYPVKPIRFIAPFVAGAGTDITARAVAAKLTERWGQQVIVDNRSGAAGTIGVDITATAIPDGYTICLISASHAVNSATNPKLPYDLMRDLQAISQATSLFYVMYRAPTLVDCAGAAHDRRRRPSGIRGRSVVRHHHFGEGAAASRRQAFGGDCRRCEISRDRRASGR